MASRTENEQMATLDVDGNSDSFEEYEWCGETRIRATSLANRALLEGAAGFHVIKHAADDEADQVFIYSMVFARLWRLLMLGVSL